MIHWKQQMQTADAKTRPKILAIDDKKENLLALEALLDDFECDLHQALSGDEGLKLVLEHDYALALLDVQMPGMNGFEVAELIRGIKKSQHLPIIFITALNESQEYKFKGYEAGAVDFMFKPLDSKILKSKVGIFLGLYEQKSQISIRAAELKQKMEKALSELEIRKQSEKIHQQTTHDNSLFVESDENEFSEIAIPGPMFLQIVENIEKNDIAALEKQLGRFAAIMEKGKLFESQLSDLIKKDDFEGALDLMETVRVV